MNTVRNRTVVCCYRGKVGTDLSGIICNRILIWCTDPWILNFLIFCWLLN